MEKIDDPQNKLGDHFYTIRNHAIEDSLGFMWIPSKKGLCRYSGSEIDCYTHDPDDPNSISGNELENIFLDDDHHIWIAIMDRGINVLDIQGNKILELEALSNTDNSLKSNRVWGMWQDEDKYVWISYFNGGISRYDKVKKELQHFSIDSNEFLASERPKTVVKAIQHREDKDVYWLATTFGLVKFNVKTREHEHFTFPSKIEPNLTESTFAFDTLQSRWCRDIIMDNEGILWIAAFGGLVRFDPNSETYKVLFKQDGFLTQDPRGIIEYDEQYLLASFNQGLMLIDKQTLKVNKLVDTRSSELYNKHCRFYQSNHGCLYLFSISGPAGIYRTCLPSSMIEFQETGTLIEKIASTENYLHYLGEHNYLYSKNYKTGKIEKSYLKEKNITRLTSMFPLDGDSLLFTSFNSVFLFHPERGVQNIKTLKLPNTSRSESIFRDRKGNLWSGRQRDGVFYFNTEKDTLINFRKDTDPAIVSQEYIQNIIEDQDGDIWFCTEDGITMLDVADMTTDNFSSTYLREKFSLNIAGITDAIQLNNGRLLFTDRAGGIFEWDKKAKSLVQSWGMNEGLNSDKVFDMLLGPDERIWMGGHKGISFLDLSTNQIASFSNAHGIQKEIYTITMNKHGELYAGTDNGFYQIDVNSFTNYTYAEEKPYVSHFKVYENKADSLLNQKKIKLNHDQNFFTFYFGSINYHNPWNEKYQYRLRGIDKNWINAGNQRQAGYTDIKPGKYTFQVRVKTDNLWSEGQEHVVIIKRAWYQTYWFRFLVGVLLFGLLTAAIVYFNKRKRRKLEIEKRFLQLETMALKSQMNPHFLFNSLNSIRYLFMKGQSEKGLSYITKFAKLLRSTLHHGEEALVPLKEEIELSELYIDLEKLRFEDSMTVEKEFPESEAWTEVLIPPFVIQPLVENAFWHGLTQSENENKILKLKIAENQHKIEVLVIDNGVGFGNAKKVTDEALNKKKSYGLNIIKERFDLLNIDSEYSYYVAINPIENQQGTEAKVTIIKKHG